VVQKATVDRRLHKDYDEARRKHFTMLLANKIKRVVKKHQTRREFYAWVDPIASRYSRADEAVEVIANNILAQLKATTPPRLRVTTRRSHDTPSIQLCDLLLGAVMAAWQAKVESPGKVALLERIATHLDWPDLRADTHVAEPKFKSGSLRFLPGKAKSTAFGLAQADRRRSCRRRAVERRRGSVTIPEVTRTGA
jgi:hypothetical protein